MHNSLIDNIWLPTKMSTTVRNVILAFAGSLLLAVSAKIAIPFFPVPFTMQTLVVLSIGMAFGPILGGATIALYLIQGAMGLPVLSGTPEKGIGLAYMVGPTGGYLVGFYLAAIACGYLAKLGWDRSYSKTLLIMLVGNAIIYVPGVLWLGYVLGWENPILAWGFTNFILSDIAKIIIASAAFPTIWKLVQRTKK